MNSVRAKWGTAGLSAALAPGVAGAVGTAAAPKTGRATNTPYVCNPLGDKRKGCCHRAEAEL
jgi:hypothetical protein